jgi:phage shock protein PspC (stress-responsive transcriptional regulator)
MKKALTITIAGSLFTIEEDAYTKLDGYLKSIQKYFGSFPDSSEIINDIEARIAEQLLDRSNRDAVVTIEDVEKLIGVMGQVADIADESDSKSDSSTTARESVNNDGPRKLYRDTDNAYIAGVAAGIAEYLDIDPIIMRIVFVLVAIFTAFIPVFIIYAILTLIIPPARTPAEKIRMRGGPVDLQSFKESMNEYAQTFKKNGEEMKDHLKQTGTEVKENVTRFFDEGSRPRGIIDNTFRLLGKIIVIFVKILLAIVGFAIMIAGVIAVSVACFVFVNLMVNPASPYIDFPFYDVMSGPLYYVILVLGFLVFAIPFALMIMIGSALLSRKKVITVYAAMIMLAVWFVSGITLATVGVRYAPIIEQKMLSAEEAQQSTKTFDVTNFKKVEFVGGHRVTILPSASSTEFSLVANGRQIDLDALRVQVENGELSVSHNYGDKICIFCWNNHESTDITLVMPEISELKVHGATQVVSTATTTSEFSLEATGASKVTLTMNGEKMIAEASGASQLNVRGSTNQLDLTVSGASKFDSYAFTTKNADIEASGASSVKITTLEMLKARASGASSMKYKGEPKTDIDTSGAAEVEHD